MQSFIEIEIEEMAALVAQNLIDSHKSIRI